MEQEPGPPGCPQVPHAPAAAGPSVPFDCAANTESFLSSSLLAQRSQLGVSEARTRVSNSWPQARQAYSKIGMARFYSLGSGLELQHRHAPIQDLTPAVKRRASSSSRPCDASSPSAARLPCA